MKAAIISAGEPARVTHRYSADFEALVDPLIEVCSESTAQPSGMSCRGTALALLEGGEAVVAQVAPEIRHAADTVRTSMRGHFGEDPGIHLARERHELATTIAEACVVRTAGRKGRLPRDAWALTTWPWTGVPLVALVAGSIFGFLFFVGELLAGAFASGWEAYASPAITSVVTSVAGDGMLSRVLLWGFDAGIEASLAIGIPYILTFYFLLGLLEDTGYLNSLAFLMDRVMHRLGLHGRAIVPFVAAAGCNVPALIAAGQLPTKRERFIASTLVLFVPCSARTAVILGAVGHYVGWQPALAVFVLLFAVWLGVGLTLEKMVPGQSRGLVMEMFGFRRPSVRRVAQKAWEQFKEFLFVATPIVVLGSLVLGGLYETGWLQTLSGPLAPVVETWLGLPAIAGLTLIVGMLRKELALQLLVALAVATAGVTAAAGLTGIMSQTDIVVYALVNAIALPCVSSLAVFWRRHGVGRTVLVVTVGVIVAVVMGGTVARVLPLLGFDA
jgi:ferrous iron transport protein B